MIVYFGGHRQRENEQVTAMATAIDGSQCQVLLAFLVGPRGFALDKVVLL